MDDRIRDDFPTPPVTPESSAGGSPPQNLTSSTLNRERRQSKAAYSRATGPFVGSPGSASPSHANAFSPKEMRKEPIIVKGQQQRSEKLDATVRSPNTASDTVLGRLYEAVDQVCAPRTSSPTAIVDYTTPERTEEVRQRLTFERECGTSPVDDGDDSAGRSRTTSFLDYLTGGTAGTTIADADDQGFDLLLDESNSQPFSDTREKDVGRQRQRTLKATRRGNKSGPNTNATATLAQSFSAALAFYQGSSSPPRSPLKTNNNLPMRKIKSAAKAALAVKALNTKKAIAYQEAAHTKHTSSTSNGSAAHARATAADETTISAVVMALDNSVETLRSPSGTMVKQTNEETETHVKQVLVAFKGAAKGPLSSISEEEIMSRESAEFKVHVSGETANVWGDNGLIEVEMIDEVEEDKAYPIDSVQHNLTSEATPSSMAEIASGGDEIGDRYSSNTASASSTFRSRVQQVDSNSDLPTRLLRKNRPWKTKPWRSTSGLFKTNSFVASKIGETKQDDPVTSQKSKSISGGKPQWKIAVDAESGRTYYYHRISRVTSWTKPPDGEVGIEVETQSKNESCKDVAKPDFDNVVWQKKEEISALLETLTPSDYENARRLMVRYSGNEDELLAQLRNLAQSQPFDESSVNAGESASFDNALDTDIALSRPTSMKSRTVTLSSLKSGTSVSTRVSEQTDVIRNTANGRRRGSNKMESDSSVTSISSQHDDIWRPGARIPYSGKPLRMDRIPSRIPVPRVRELVAEDLSSPKGFRISQKISVAHNSQPTIPRRVKSLSPPEGNENTGSKDDLKQTDEIKDFDSMGLNDDISALSMADIDYPGHRICDTHGARRRPVDDVFARKESHLVAAQSGGTLHSKQPVTGSPAHRWTQAQLDGFIALNDWDAVAKHISQVQGTNRKVKTEKNAVAFHSRIAFEMQQEPLVQRSQYDEVNGGHVQKRLGGRFQRRHDGMHSASSRDMSSVDDTDAFSTVSEYAEERRRRSNRIRRATRGFH